MSTYPGLEIVYVDPFAAVPAKQSVTPKVQVVSNEPTYEGVEYSNTEAYTKEGFTGQTIQHEHWYLCAMCSVPKPRSETTMVDGKRVCLRHVDETSVDYASAPKIVSDLMKREVTNMQRKP